MGYVYLALSVIAGAINAFGTKKQSNCASTVSSATLTSFIRMVVSVITGICLLVLSGTDMSLLADAKTVIIAVFGGMVFSGYVIVWLFSVRKGAFMLSTVFVMMGVIITVALGVIFFNETVTVRQIIGLMVLVLASVVMCSYSAQIKGKITLGAAILLILCGVLTGLNDFSQKIFINQVENASPAVYNFYVYLFASVILGITALFLNQPKFKQGVKSREVLKKVIIPVTVMGVATLLCYYFKTYAAAYLPSSIVYPMFQGVTLPLMSVISAVFFGERITFKSAIGIALALISMILINM